MNVLIVEASSHTKVLENVYHLLKSKCSLTFYLNDFGRGKDDLFLLFPSASEVQLITNRFHDATFFIWLLFYGRKYDYINISTGPETSYFSQIFNIIFFSICCFVYREKIILTVKNTRPYLRSTGGFFAFLRSKSIKNLKRFTFESQTQRDYFIKCADIKTRCLGVSYDRYSDLLDSQFYYPSERLPSDPVRIGLLGTISCDRRDYKVIIAALKQMSSEERSSITFVTLAGFRGEDSNEIIGELSEYVKIDDYQKKRILSAHEFDVRGASCHLLISPLTKKYGYGKFKGSGSFGDAAYLRRKIILPSYVDDDGEFADISLYYRDIDDLLNIFKNIKELAKAELEPQCFERFKTDNVFTRLVNDLELC